MTGLIFATLLVLIFEGASAQANPSCEKLPDIKGFPDNTSCCDFPQLYTQSTLDACQNEIGDKTKNDDVKHCKLVECIFRKNKLIKSDGSLDKETIGKYLEELLSDKPDLLKFVKPIATDYCLNAIENGYPKMVEYFKANKMFVPLESQCSSLKPNLMAFCIPVQILSDCPASISNNNSKCQEWKKYSKTCSGSVDDMLEFLKQLNNINSARK
ncbi:general odorant-binding protein 68-like [Uranotaenia lowii]|uniref:general odorant-binding protein 68-like n=1 Tax=Uranotaenia lowii TaxID=190385 RepID=UPI002479033F|nr:general odorant-binding protein 68-like [Uranotaenia lowii]